MDDVDPDSEREDSSSSASDLASANFSPSPHNRGRAKNKGKCTRSPVVSHQLTPPSCASRGEGHPGCSSCTRAVCRTHYLCAICPRACSAAGRTPQACDGGPGLHHVSAVLAFPCPCCAQVFIAFSCPGCRPTRAPRAGRMGSRRDHHPPRLGELRAPS